MSQSFIILKTTAIKKHGNGLRIRIGYTDQWNRTEILRSKQPIVANCQQKWQRPSTGNTFSLEHICQLNNQCKGYL